VICIAIIWMYFNETQLGFYLIGSLAGFGMAGAQSVSRTMVGMFAPEGQSAQFYGFFAVAGRSSSFIGPTIYGIIAAEAALFYERSGLSQIAAEQQGQRLAILSILVFLVIGAGLLLFWVNEKKAKEMALAG
jgi:UMF1 family MFS transporter